MKVLVTGANGQLGTDVVLALEKKGFDVKAAGRSEIDITNFSDVSEKINKFMPECVIHCAAYTNVDMAEEERNTCKLINVTGTENIAKAAVSVGASIMYISSDYVFDGTNNMPMEIDDKPNPINYYGMTKLLGEEAVKKTTDKYYILRTSWIFGENGKNFVKTMLNLSEKNESVSVVNDQIGSPTYTADLAKLISNMISVGHYGIYHATNEGFCSWADFAREIFAISNKNTEVIPINSSEYPSKAKRPFNSMLSKRCLEINGFERLPIWKDALTRFLNQHFF